jgi:hypothetical protein
MSQANTQLSVGDVVCHPDHGEGVVQEPGVFMSVIRPFGKPETIVATRHLTFVRAQPLPPAANDNKPFSLADWVSSNYVGDPPPIEYLISGVVESGIPGMVAAMGEVGKSYTLLEVGRRIAFGSTALSSPILGGQVEQEGTAVIMTGEDDRNAMHRRLAAIDPQGARFAEKGDKLIVVPMPSAVPAIRPYWKDGKNGPEETDEWRRLCDQLAAIDDLRMVTIDPLQLFAALPINEDPAAGQFVCGSIATLAAHTGANVFFAHHMKKSGRDVTTLADARDSIRGTTALVDGVRLAYGLWYPDKAGALKICKQIPVPYAPNRIVYGGVVKANGAARRVLSTYARNDFGLLVDRSAALGTAAIDLSDLRAVLVVAIEAAAEAGQPFMKTGKAGLWENRERLPEEIRPLSKAKLMGLADEALEAGEIVKATAKGEKAAGWLDVPGGQFAIGIGEFRTGSIKH